MTGSSSLVGQGQGAPADRAQGGHPPSQQGGAAGGPRGRLRQRNEVWFSGVLVADPLPDVGRDGEPTLILLVAFDAPDPLDTEELPPMVQQEVEVPGQLALERGEELTAGASIFVAGSLSGGGGILAAALLSGPPPDDWREAPHGSG
jgi:hypothetical protein